MLARFGEPAQHAHTDLPGDGGEGIRRQFRRGPETHDVVTTGFRIEHAGRCLAGTKCESGAFASRVAVRGKMFWMRSPLQVENNGRNATFRRESP
jgi:hypothetical protein